MIEYILNTDKEFFLLINNGLANPFLDWLCPWLRKQEIWYPLYALIVYFIIRMYKKESWKILLAGALMILGTDQFSANLVKNTFMRLRPCNEPSLAGQVRHLIESCNGYSFISAHATNHFAIAVFVICYFKSYSVYITPIALLWASSIIFSQVYVGVHYPLDVIVGGLTGSLFGYAFAKYSLKYIKIVEKRQNHQDTKGTKFH